MAKTQANDLIDLIVKRAPELHAAGITSLTIEGQFTVALVTLAPPPSPLDQGGTEAPPAPPQHIDPMHDPASYQGGAVPGFKRPKE